MISFHIHMITSPVVCTFTTLKHDYFLSESKKGNFQKGKIFQLRVKLYTFPAFYFLLNKTVKDGLRTVNSCHCFQSSL